MPTVTQASTPEVLPTGRRHKRLRSPRNLITAQSLCVRTLERSHQTSAAFNLPAPYIHSRGGSISRRHESPQQKTAAPRNTNGHEKRHFKNTCDPHHYSSISSQGRSRNKCAFRRKSSAKEARSGNTGEGATNVLALLEKDTTQTIFSLLKDSAGDPAHDLCMKINWDCSRPDTASEVICRSSNTRTKIFIAS